MFGWRKEITNLECDIIAVKGCLCGLNYRLNSLIKINDSDTRYQLEDEIEIVKKEIDKKQSELLELESRLNPPTI